MVIQVLKVSLIMQGALGGYRWIVTHQSYGIPLYKALRAELHPGLWRRRLLAAASAGAVEEHFGRKGL